jgi:predicted dehydrogenase
LYSYIQIRDGWFAQETSLMKKLNIGFVGFGHQAAKQHARYLVEKCANVAQIIAICDILDADVPFVHKHLEHLGLQDVSIHTARVNTRFDPEDTESLEELLEQHQDIDALIISTPNAKHFWQAKVCLERKLHVLVDKPPALTYQQGRQLVDLATKLDKTYLMVSNQRRYEKVYQYAKQVIVSKELGEIISVDCIISHSSDWLQGWRSDPERAGGGVLWDNAWHSLDTLLFLVDKKALAVDAALYYSGNALVETHASALIHFEGDLSVTLTANFGAPRNSVYERLQIWGTQGMLTLDRSRSVYDDRPPIVAHQMSDGRILKPDLTGAVAKKWAPTEAFIRLLLSCSRSQADYQKARASVVSTGVDSLETLRIIEAICASAQRHNRLNLAENF